MTAPTEPQAQPQVLDWTLVHARMAAVNRALEQATQLSGAGLEGAGLQGSSAERVLQQRARALAQVPAADAEQSQSIDVLEFELAGEHYGLDASYVQEVCALKRSTAKQASFSHASFSHAPFNQICPLPGTPAYVRGIVYLRGRMLSVLDLRPLFDLAQDAGNEPNQLIVVQDADMEFGLLAETIIGVRPLALDCLQAALPTMTGQREAYLLGISPERTVVLAAERLLQDPNFIINESP